MTPLVTRYRRDLRQSPRQTVYVLAGWLNEVREWEREHPEYRGRHIANETSLMGVFMPCVARTGTWRDRHDLERIEERLHIVHAVDFNDETGRNLGRNKLV